MVVRSVPAGLKCALAAWAHVMNSATAAAGDSGGLRRRFAPQLAHQRLGDDRRAGARGRRFERGNERGTSALAQRVHAADLSQVSVAGKVVGWWTLRNS